MRKHLTSSATHTRNSQESQDPRWRAVLAHDARMDHAFVYGVRSTGIYCKPSCPSRRPRPEQVVFYVHPKAAESAGFRPCLRCRPNQVDGQKRIDPQAAFVERVCRQIERRSDAPARLSELAAQGHTSPHSLLRAFRRLIGVTPRQYADTIRLRKLKDRLQTGDDVTTALYGAGYGSSSRLYERAHQQLGMTPAVYRKGGRNMQIAYTIEPCTLGRILVAATPKGISAVYLGDREQSLARALREEYPQAEIRRDSRSLGNWVRAILSHLSGKERHLDLPLDVEATAFQRRVWEELRKIPYGKTNSYSQIASAIGRPAATRAVARACATNPVSILVPCHRVVRQDGKSAGYRWGVEKKRELLSREKAATA
ncbi:MAG TPA: bifunctional DNA-binding transcriptional regulator/O6-methylguanine-DNA methyltransferase Ada [Candidatus Acidoferrales bacterium]|nr:bifunctional DNA-binding transcriptional regulator/O6-methylguanine-DNA methyltransferase Ada [Candidatus Acidoferrales bacterium]